MLSTLCIRENIKILLQAEGKSYIVTNITTIVNVLINVGKIILIIAGFQVLAVQVVFFAFNVLQMALFEIYIHKNYGWIDLSVEPNEAAISQKKFCINSSNFNFGFFQTQMYWYYLFFQD